MTLADEARVTSLHLLQQENARLRRENRELRDRLNEALSEVDRLTHRGDQLDALLEIIPPCPLHGAGCYKFALNWVKTAAQMMSIFEDLPKLREGTHQ